jgi:hypothetical protein
MSEGATWRASEGCGVGMLGGRWQFVWWLGMGPATCGVGVTWASWDPAGSGRKPYGGVSTPGARGNFAGDEYLARVWAARIVCVSRAARLLRSCGAIFPENPLAFRNVFESSE